MKTTTKHLVPALLLALTLTLVAEAQPGQGKNRRGGGQGMQAGQNQRGPQMDGMQRGGPRSGPNMGIMRYLRQLNLTTEQRESIRSLLETNKEAAQATHEAMQKARQSLHEAVMNGADEAAIRTIGGRFAQVVGDEAIQQVALNKKIKGVLTKDQQEKLTTLMKQAPEDFQRGPQGPRERMGRGRGRMQGRRQAGPPVQ
jgi:Spy/CpxP family protein refolding chaperone